MDLGLRSMAPTDVCVSQSPAVYFDRFSSFGGSKLKRDATSSPKRCGFKAWTTSDASPGSMATPEQRPTILFQLLQHEDLSGDDFQRMDHTGIASKVDVDAIRIRSIASGKAPRSFSSSDDSTTMTLTDGSSSPSQGSVASSDGTLEDGGLLVVQLRPRGQGQRRPRAESFLESTTTQLLSLTTKCSPFEWVDDDDEGAKDFSVHHQDPCSSAPPVARSSPPNTIATPLPTTRRRRSVKKLCPSRIDLGAIDLTCKRRCSRDSTLERDISRKKSGITTALDISKEPVRSNGSGISKQQSNAREPDISVKSGISREPGCSRDPYKLPSAESGCKTESGLKGKKIHRWRCCRDVERRTDETSILKSILTGRNRSQSFSGAVTKLPVGGQQQQQQQQGCVPMATTGSYQRVALAKRNMMPVLARIADRLTGAIGFARSLPEFLQFPDEDQVLLLVQACPRLLLLYLAEDNFQFAVTPVRSAAETKTDAVGGGGEPTMQFVETVQNFIGKCQTHAIGATEYFYMRMIVLFHTGSIGVLLRSDLAKRIGCEAVQDLHALVGHLHGDDKLRYSRLLLTLYTLFGINGSMVEALFCSQISSLGGIRAFVEHELRSEASSVSRSATDDHGEK